MPGPLLKENGPLGNVLKTQSLAKESLHQARIFFGGRHSQGPITFGCPCRNVPSCVLSKRPQTSMACFVVFVGGDSCRQLAAKGSIILLFTIVPLVIGPVYSNSTPWGVYSPAAITALVTIQAHKQSGIHYSWVERMQMQVKCLVQGHSATPRQPRSVLKISQSKVTGHNHRATTPCMRMGYIFWMYRDTCFMHVFKSCDM